MMDCFDFGLKLVSFIVMLGFSILVFDGLF